MKGINLKIQELRETLAKEINDAQLPIGVSRMIVSDLLSCMKVAEQSMITAEKQVYEKEAAEKEGVKDGKEIH